MEYQRRRRHAIKLPHYEIDNIQPLGFNPLITAFLKETGLWQAAQQKLKEVYYHVQDEKGTRKQFFAAGHQNELGNWQVFGRHFSGCIGLKALTIIDGTPGQANIYLSYADYLLSPTEHTAIIVNDGTLLQQALAKARAYPKVVFNNPLPEAQKL